MNARKFVDGIFKAVGLFQYSIALSGVVMIMVTVLASGHQGMRIAPSGTSSVVQLAAAVPNTAMGAGWIMNAPQYARLVAAGYTGPAPQYLVCGDGGGEDGNPCTPGETPTFMDVNKLKTALAAGLRGTVLLDIEGWTYTPAWQAAHEPQVLAEATRLGRQYKVRLIAAPVTKASVQQAVEVDAAKDGVYAVELQDQYATSQPKRYGTIVNAAVTAIRKVSKHVVIFAGIASDPDGWPVTANQMFWSWGRVHLKVAGFWLNAAEWFQHGNGQPTSGCAPTGCVTVADAFLHLTGGAA